MEHRGYVKACRDIQRAIDDELVGQEHMTDRYNVGYEAGLKQAKMLIAESMIKEISGTTPTQEQE